MLASSIQGALHRYVRLRFNSGCYSALMSATERKPTHKTLTILKLRFFWPSNCDIERLLRCMTTISAGAHDVMTSDVPSLTTYVA